MPTYSRGCTCVRRQLKETVFRGTITWSEMEKQNIQAKKVYSLALKTIRPMFFSGLLSLKKGIIVKRQ